jgi:DNA-binding CsgD family transcriptional regulator
VILGRQFEQDLLNQGLGRLRSGEGWTLVVVGEIGMGKTTLLDWVCQIGHGLDHEEIAVLRAGGRESEADLPFTAIADLIRPLEDRIGSLPVPQARALGRALALVDGADGDRLAVNAAVLNLLGSKAREHPLLLVVDDYHWLDSASRGVIDFIARRTGPVGIGLILATRGLSPADHGGEEMILNALSDEAAAALVLSADRIHPELVQRIVELAGGNPLALIELPIGLTDPQRRGGLSLEAPLTVSAGVERAFRSRLERLTVDARQALLCVAEEGTGTLAVIERALSRLGLDRHSLDESVAAGLLIVDGPSVRFRHPLLRSVAHQTADPGEVRSIHRMLASEVDDEDQQAWHLAAAAQGADEMAAAALEEAAKRALSRGAAAPAASALQRAAELSEDIPAKVARVSAAARAAHRAGNMSLTATLIDEARTLTGWSHADPTMLLLDADIRMRKGDYAGACGTLRLEAGRIAARDPRRAATMLLLAAKLRVYRFEAVQAVREVERALELVPEIERDVVHLASVAMTAVMAGAPGARAATLQAMDSAMLSPHGHTHTLGIGWPLVWLEEYEPARAFITRSVDLQRAGGHLAYLPQALLPMAELDFRTGGWDLARTNAAEALRLFEEGQQPTEAAVASAMLARLEAACGDADAARAHAAAAERTDLSSGLRAATAHAESALGLLELGMGNHLRAIDHLQEARFLAEVGGIGEPNLLALHADLAEALARQGDREAASAVATELLQMAERVGRQSARAAGLRCQGLVALDDAFRGAFEDALLIHRGLPNPFELARTELCFGERLRRNRSRLEARRHLRHALTVFELLGAEPWAERCRTELASTGETIDRSRPGRTLTPQERQVANIVAAGATNREAAASLFVNLKTIEFHLGNVYRKLGVRSRTELANALRRGEVGVSTVAGADVSRPTG